MTLKEPAIDLSEHPFSAIPKVSVIVPAFNVPPELLHFSLLSISAQTFSDFECLVIDESVDPALVRSCRQACECDPRFRYIHPENRLGLAGSLNLGISLSKGELVARFDSDDLCLPDRLQRQVDYLAQHPDVDILGGGLEIIDFDDRTIAYRRYPETHDRIVRQLQIMTPIAHPTVMARKHMLMQAGGYNTNFHYAEDIELWLRLLAQGARFANLNEILVRYRQPEAIRNRRHWIFNLRARLRNFRFSFLPLRIAGIVMIAVWTFLPAWMQSRIVHCLIFTRRNDCA